MGDLIDDMFGIDADADAADLACDLFGLRMAGRDARAVHAYIWIITSAIELGAAMKASAVPAVRLRTGHDARLAGDPGAAAGNLAVLLGLAVCHGSDHVPHLLPPADNFAAAVDEAGQHARDRREREGNSGEVERVEMLELEDLAGRGYIHVGRAAASRVAWRQIRGDD